MSIFDRLKKREAERELSADQFIRQAIAAVAAGDEDKLDLGKLEGHLQVVGWSLEQFEDAVERQQAIDKLREIVANKDKVIENFKTVSETALQNKRDYETQIEELRQAIIDDEQAVAEARRRVDAIQQSEQRLRQLEPAGHREGRMLLKEDCSRLRRLKQDILNRRETANSRLKNPGRFSTSAGKQAHVEQQRQTIAECDEQIVKVEKELGEAVARFEQAEAEAIGASVV